MRPAEGEKIHFELLRNKTGQERLKMALDLNELVKKIAADGIRYQRPNISQTELNKQLALRIRHD
ncbi:hypothetical protein HZB07_03780 [Candidatus Saganbacteria bacterium]|nr:hypothetical protein [Candidatus Saganbacteria bacterium]